MIALKTMALSPLSSVTGSLPLEPQTGLSRAKMSANEACREGFLEDFDSVSEGAFSEDGRDELVRLNPNVKIGYECFVRLVGARSEVAPIDSLDLAVDPVGHSVALLGCYRTLSSGDNVEPQTQSSLFLPISGDLTRPESPPKVRR
ncbi:hypothetical protein [Leifsonia xyli]|uniref:hypothetical protein n=1 Tax=Leifsonia xyli TaxID=1575 RepID=UPI00114CDFEB|nr:hypothetical protein [Leifsonia xyli]